MMRRLVALFLAMLLTVVTATAWAYWSANSLAGGNGAAAASSVNQGATPSVSAAGQVVTVTWAARTLSSGQPVSGYLIKRYDATTLATQTMLTACNGTVTATSCTENAVPAGSWIYTVTPVVGANWRGDESAKSGAVTVTPPDTTPPKNAITLSSVSGGAFLSASTLYYRGSVTGSVRLTSAVSDAGSGPASSATAVLGGTATGWSHNPSMVSTPAGGPFVSSPFGWTAGTISAPTEVVTARDTVGNSTTTSLSFANDSTAPTSGTINYGNGFAPGRSVSVSFTTGTDAGSGIATQRLQRAAAALSNGTCGSFGGFGSIATNNPTPPYVDGSLASGCYKYRYVVTDRVGNQHIATSPNVAMLGYAGAVNATAGLLSHWRLGEGSATLGSSDSFTGPAGALVTSGPGEIGATWIFNGGANGDIQKISSQNRAYRAGNSYTLMYTSATPATADYAVEADLYVQSYLAGDAAGVVGRMDPATNTFYVARWEQSNASWNVVKYVNGAPSSVGALTAQPALVAGQAYRLRLEMAGTSLKLFVNGALKVSATDTSITAAGKAGTMDGLPGGTLAKSDTAGLHYDNFQVTPASYPRAADNKGANTGDYENGSVLGVPGALAGDSNTAARFDGLNDHVQVLNSTGLPTGAGVRSVEAWFKTASSAQQVLFAYGSVAETQEFGLWLNQGGTAMTAWGFGEANGHNKVFNLSRAANDDAWHHSVLTYNGSSLTLYVDGVAIGTQAALRNTVLDSYGFSIGAVVNPSTSAFGGFFNGSIDEVSLYTTVLSQATVTDHYQLGGAAAADLAGPTGGSVDISGLVGTGSRYSTSTTLNLVLAKGSDPSGVADTGAELRRATASLSSGTCGIFGIYSLVNDGADPSSPKFDVVDDQACYRYAYAVADMQGNSTTYTSDIIKVDTTAPAAPTLSFSAFNNTYATGSTVYYRSGAAPGSFTATAAATDPASGIARYTFPELGSNWSSTPGALGVNTYSWSGAPEAPGTKNITTTNNAGSVSADSPFTLVSDNAAPSAGAVTYSDGGTSSTTVSVSFTTGTDSGSGIRTRLLQRASAPLTDSTCGTFTSFATVTGGTNPVSPFVDSTSRGICYQYRYVVTDNVGNQQVATNANVVKVWPTYINSINATAGLVNFFRLGEATTSSDSFAGTTGAILQNRTGEIGSTWTSIASSANATLTNAGRIRKAGTDSAGALYYASGIPTGPDYTVETDVYVASTLVNDTAGVVGRLDPTSSSGTYYYARYEQPNQAWLLYKVVNGTWGWLGQFPQTLTPGQTYRLSLDMTGSSIRVLVDGEQRVSVSDTVISPTGRGGVALGFQGTGTTVYDNTGMQLDNFRITPPLADSKGGNNGDYLSGPTLSAPGAIAGDASTAAEFDGANDFGTVARQISDDFSVEFWFKSTQGIGTGTQWWQGAGLVDAEVPGAANDFGVSLRADGRVVAGAGSPDVSIVSPTGNYNNGGWHHVVFTRTRASGALALYVDGVAAGSATGSTASLTSAANINFGRLLTGMNYYKGFLDEVATYSTALTEATIAAHYGAGR